MMRDYHHNLSQAEGDMETELTVPSNLRRML